MKPPDQGLEELKKGLWEFLRPRLWIGLGILVLAALYIFWPR